MASPHGDTESTRSLSANTGGGADTSGDEIDLIDYFTVLWRRRYFIVLGTVLPSLLVFSISYYTPGDCRISYTYDIRNVESGTVGLSGSVIAEAPAQPDGSPQTQVPPGTVRTTLADRFYSDENLDKLAARLKERGFDDFAMRLARTNVQLEVSETSLTLTVTARQQEDIRGISSVVRDNLEKVTPMYFVKDHLRGEIAGLKAAMADIEEDNSRLELELARKKAILARLKTLASTEPAVASGGLTLQLDSLPGSSECLPLPYQVQAADANIVYIEETINANREKCNHYGMLQSLDEKLLEELRNKTSSYYTIEDFCSLVTRMATDHEDGALGRHLSAYARRIENVISAITPIVETPRVNAVPKSSLKKTGMVFAALLMVTTFGVFLLEATQKSRKPGSAKSS